MDNATEEINSMNRRTFLKMLSILLGGLVVPLPLPTKGEVGVRKDVRLISGVAPQPFELTTEWVTITSFRPWSEYYLHLGDYYDLF